MLETQLKLAYKKGECSVCVLGKSDVDRALIMGGPTGKQRA